MDKFITWIDERLPVSNFVKNHLSQYYAPKNFNFFYYFGALAIFIFILQIVTGMHLSFLLLSIFICLELCCMVPIKTLENFYGFLACLYLSY